MSIKETATICFPIKKLNDLFDVSLSCLTNRFKSSPLLSRHTTPRQKILLCHDMKGGYLEDRHVQGCETKESCYRFFRWHLIDIFVYFSHELVTIPPVVWIDCAHKNGVQILGVFITEFDNGKEICRELLASDDNIDRVVDALALIMAWYNFDGYLLNIENPIETEHVSRLLSFVSKLKSACANIDPNSLIIWYDSVTKEGELEWQNRLNDLNEPFFNVCDGIFLNYTWKSEMLLESMINAGDRCQDVFVGIDVFGRGCFGGGGFNTCEAMAISHKNNLSTAIFAPGWIFETLDLDEFLENDRKFWNLLEPYTSQRILPMKSLTTYFSDGFGKSWFIHGLNFAQNSSWYNLSLQSLLPNVLNENQWFVNHDDAYFGGSCIELKAETNGYFRLFKCLIPIESVCDITLVFKYTTDPILELKFDDGRCIHLEKSENDLIVHQWKRKTYRIVVDERVSITDIAIHYVPSTNSTIKLGYFSILPVQSQCIKLEPLPPLIQSIEQTSNSSIVLRFVNAIQEQPSSVILVFIRTQYEQYSFVGATHQPYFVIYQSAISDNSQKYSMLIVRHYSLENFDLINEQILKIPIRFNCLQAYDKQFDQLKAKIDADPDCVKKKDRDGRTVLHWACSSGAKDIVQYLLDICHIRPDIPDELGWTPLIIAVSTGHLEIVRMLLQTNKVDVEQSNSIGARPLHYACSKNYYEIAELLLEHNADVNATDKYKQTPLDRCCSKGHTRIVALLLKHPQIDLSLHKECDGDHSLPLYQK